MVKKTTVDGETGEVLKEEVWFNTGLPIWSVRLPEPIRCFAITRKQGLKMGQMYRIDFILEDGRVGLWGDPTKGLYKMTYFAFAEPRPATEADNDN